MVSCSILASKLGHGGPDGCPPGAVQAEWWGSGAVIRSQTLPRDQLQEASPRRLGWQKGGQCVGSKMG